MSDIVTSDEARQINSSIAQEDRAILDYYIDLLVDGDFNPLDTMVERINIKRSTLGRFLAVPAHKTYVQQKLDYWLTCADIDRYRILEDLRTVASASINDFFHIEGTSIRLKHEDEIPKHLWRAVKKIKLNNFGFPEIELHSKQAAQTLLAKLHKMLSQELNVTTTVEHKDRLFDLPSANGPKNSPSADQASPSSILDEYRLADDESPRSSKILNETSNHNIDLPTEKRNKAQATSYKDWNDPTQFYFDQDEE